MSPTNQNHLPITNNQLESLFHITINQSESLFHITNNQSESPWPYNPYSAMHIIQFSGTSPDLCQCQFFHSCMSSIGALYMPMSTTFMFKGQGSKVTEIFYYPIPFHAWTLKVRDRWKFGSPELVFILHICWSFVVAIISGLISVMHPHMSTIFAMVLSNPLANCNNINIQGSSFNDIKFAKIIFLSPSLSHSFSLTLTLSFLFRCQTSWSYSSVCSNFLFHPSFPLDLYMFSWL